MRPTPDPAPAGRRACDSSARRMSAALAAMGVLHFVRPEPFDGLIPPFLPGSARGWTHGSGVAELAVAGLLAVPRTRRAGGRAAQALFLGVWPGNAWMAWRWRRRPWPAQLVSLGRLPLQVPLIRAAGRVARS